MSDYNQIQINFLEIIARAIDVYDQQSDPDISEHEIDFDRWLDRYRGASAMPTDQIELNIFRNRVQAVVGQLMHSLNKKEVEQSEQDGEL